MFFLIKLYWVYAPPFEMPVPLDDSHSLDVIVSNNGLNGSSICMKRFYNIRDILLI